MRSQRGPARALRAFALILALGGLGCGSDDAAPGTLAGFNLVVINVDTLRADHLGMYGYARATSPFLDALARQGVLFERASASSSYTRESVAALLSGHLPSTSGASGWYAAPARGERSLGPLLRAAGYRTAFFSNTVMLTDPGFTQGFDDVAHLPRRWDVSGAGPLLSARALELVRSVAGQRFALYLHYLDPHAPYEPTDELYLQFSAQRLPHPLALYRDVVPRLEELRAEGFGPGDPRFDDMVVRYDAEILSTDRAIAQLFGGLRELRLLERTLVVVTADHGEEFLEHDGVEHGWTLYEESLRVPLLFWAGTALAPARVPTRVSQVDVLPSILALLDLDAPVDLDGRALFAPTPGGPRPSAAARPQIAELRLGRRNVLRSVVHDGWKYVTAQRWVPPARRAAEERATEDAPEPTVAPWGPLVREELYDLERDPGELRDRTSAAPERLAELRAILAHDAETRRTRAAPPAVPAAQVTPDEQERLEALGYH